VSFSIATVPAASTQGPEHTVVDELGGVIRRRKAIILATTLGMILVVYLGLWFVPERYEAAAELLVMLGRENTQAPVVAQKGNVYPSGVQREEINSDIQLLKSRELIEGVVDVEGLDAYRFEPPSPHTLWEKVRYEAHQAKRWATETLSEVMIRVGLKKQLTDREKVIQMIGSNLDVTRQTDSNVIRVALRLPNGDVATSTVSTLIRLYIGRYSSLRMTAMAIPVFDKQLDADRIALAMLHDERQQILHKWQLSSVDRQRAELLGRLQKVEDDADSRRSQMAAQNAKLSVLTSRVAALPEVDRDRETTEPNPVTRSLQERLIDLRMKRMEVGARYRDTSVPLYSVAQIDQEIAAVNGLLAKENRRQQGEVRLQNNPVRLSLQNQAEQARVDLSGLAAAIQADEEHAAVIRAELDRLNEGEARLQMVDLQLDVASKRFTNDSAQRDAARIDEIMDNRQVVNVAVLTDATAAPEPVSPQKLRILGFGAVGGLVIGGLLGMLLEWGDDTIHDGEGLARTTQLPLLGEFHLGASSAFSYHRAPSPAGGHPHATSLLKPPPA
jgi:polysaccharide biosynthesis protein PslE